MSTPESPASTSSPGCGAYLLFGLTAVWLIAASAAVEVIAWYAQQILMIEGLDMPGWVWLPITWGHALVVGVPALLLAVFSHTPRLKAAYAAWSVASLFIAVLALARVFPITWNQTIFAAQIALCLLFALGLFIVLRTRRRSLGLGLGGLAPAALLAPLVSLPLLLWGSLGSPLDTFLSLLAGLCLGLTAGLILDAFFFRPAFAGAALGGRDVLFAGLVVAVALAVLGSGFGVDGNQLLLLVVLPPLGLAAAAVARSARSPAVTALAVLIGLVAGAVFMFVDPDELLLILGDGEILAWANRAAWLSFFVSLVAGLAALAFAALSRGGLSPAGTESAPRPGRLLPVLAAAALVWIVAIAVYGLAGHPGFYGERFFVILRAQADLSAAPLIADRNQRLAYVYDALVQQADSTQAKLRGTFQRLGIQYTPYYLENAIEVSGGPLLRTYVQLQPEVDRVLPSPHLRPLPRPAAPLAGSSTQPPGQPDWNITTIGADRVWSEFGATGQGIVVGQSDSGVQGDHPALAESYRGRAGGDDYNWYDPWNDTAQPTDAGGHGTHTLGSVLGQGGIGVAPGATWFGCVNLARNLANPAYYLDCMQFMLAPFPRGGDPLRDGDPARAAHVLNNSWGCPALEGCDARSLQPAVAALRAAGVFVVASAGNEGPLCSSVRDPIAIYPQAFSVGAVDSAGNLAFFSSRGPVTVDGSNRLKPDIVAPGFDVVSSLPGGTYGPESGTSMAGPHVAGAVALLWSAVPALIGDIDRTEQILRDSARPFTGAADTTGSACEAGPLPNNAVGYGLLDVYAAVQAAKAAP